METADILTRVAKEMSYDLTVVGVPKTIDNDVGDDEFKIIDHTPGYASCARYWANIIQNVEEENRGMHTSECVAVLQAMGRKSGWITAASAWPIRTAKCRFSSIWPRPISTLRSWPIR